MRQLPQRRARLASSGTQRQRVHDGGRERGQRRRVGVASELAAGLGRRERVAEARVELRYGFLERFAHQGIPHRLGGRRSEDQLVQSERNATVSLIAVYKALGGGWSS